MTNTTPTQAAPAKCPYCTQAITTPHTMKIIDRAYDHVMRKQYVRTRAMDFCSSKCGGNYQMGCEG
ncbi:hypothetical protein LMG28138_01852 [Pararobbsia alpina]|uniref:Uncharacterized protein n=1 Tax=Pararobbsia alpina TaxID=621374 RepID=A0A6S7B1F0_9BURK|nr:hypothetical protein LMG28138_01852 [Pararobbsia alpina]